MKITKLESTIGHFQIYNVRKKQMAEEYAHPLVEFELSGVILDGPLSGVEFSFDIDQYDMEDLNVEV
jgi:hypothetical protein